MNANCLLTDSLDYIVNKFEHVWERGSLCSEVQVERMREVRSGDPCMMGVSWGHYWGLGISLYGVGAEPGMGPLQIDRHKRLKTLPSRNYLCGR